jgi:ankyrin repeat protein
MFASTAAHFDVVDMLISMGSRIDMQAGDGMTALMKACLYSTDKHIDIVARLLNKGASVNIKSNNGRTALYYAAEKDHMVLIQMLLSKGADVDIKNSVSLLVLLFFITFFKTFNHLNIIFF